MGISVTVLITFVIQGLQRSSPYGKYHPSGDPDRYRISKLVTGYWWAGLGAVVLIYLGRRRTSRTREEMEVGSVQAEMGRCR